MGKDYSCNGGQYGGESNKIKFDAEEFLSGNPDRPCDNGRGESKGKFGPPKTNGDLPVRVGSRDVKPVNLRAHATTHIFVSRYLVPWCRTAFALRYCQAKKIVNITFNSLALAVKSSIPVQRIVIWGDGSCVSVGFSFQRFGCCARTNPICDLKPSEKSGRDKSHHCQKNRSSNSEIHAGWVI